MIDADVVKVLDGHLLEGEAIFWAEKTNHSAQSEHRKRYHLTPRRGLALKCLCALGLIGLIVMFNIPKGIENWGTSGQRLLFYAFSAVSLYSLIIPLVLLFLNMVVKGRVYTVGAYGLTNKRLFELGHDMEIIRHLDASRLRHVYGFDGVTIKPIGARGNWSYQLGLMKNNVLTINFLSGKIRQARQQET